MARENGLEAVDLSAYLPEYEDVMVDEDFRERQRERADELGLSRRQLARGIGKSWQWLNEVWWGDFPGDELWRELAAFVDYYEALSEEETEER